MLNFKGQLVYTLNAEDTTMIQETFGSVSPNVAPLHVSLLSFAECKPFKKMWKGLDVDAMCADIEAPAITKESIQSLCKARKTMDDGEVRIVHFIELGSNAWNAYRNAVLTALDTDEDTMEERIMHDGVDPKEHYHITIENNGDGDPYKSIGNPHALPLINPGNVGIGRTSSVGYPEWHNGGDYMIRWHLNDAIPDTPDGCPKCNDTGELTVYSGDDEYVIDCPDDFHRF